MIYIKTFEQYISEDLTGQVLAGNSAADAPQNTNTAMEQQPEKGSIVEFWYTPPSEDGKKPKEEKAKGKIIGIQQVNYVIMYTITLNVEGSDRNSNKSNDKNSTVVPENKIISPVAGINMPGSGHVSQNNANSKTMNSYAGGGGDSPAGGNFGASAVSNDLVM